MSSEDSRAFVFAYGSNMLTARMQGRAQSSRAIRIGQLAGYQLCWNKRSKDGSGKCSVTETGLPKHVVWGVVYEMSTEDKSILDRAEGLGQGCGERAVRVSSRSSHLRATVYYATSIHPGLRPYDWYRDLVVAGAREYEFPEEYIRDLEAVDAMNDSDSERAEMNRQSLKPTNTNNID